jgi:hypothetical protein
MRYTVHPAPALAPPDADWGRPCWTSAETLHVSHYSWEDSGHHPPTCARLLYDDRVLAVSFRVEDRYVRAVARHFQDSVCLDSCVEFFVAPVPGSDAYFNFEVNCGGTMLVHRCASTAERAAGKQTHGMAPLDAATIAMAHSLPVTVDPEITQPTTWTVEYHLPFVLFERYFGVEPPRAGTVWRGNFYKCADATSHPHWGSWAPVGGARPNFHQPAFFQPIEFA